MTFMFFDMEDPLSLFIDVIDKGSGKSLSEAGIMLTEWDTKTKTGKERRCMNNSGNDNSRNTLFVDVKTHIPNAKTILRIPKGRFDEELIGRLISQEKDVEFIVDN